MTADITDRLRAVWRTLHERALPSDAKVVSEAVAEIKRLRAALHEIAAMDRTGYSRVALGRVARAALAESSQ